MILPLYLAIASVTAVFTCVILLALAGDVNRKQVDKIIVFGMTVAILNYFLIAPLLFVALFYVFTAFKNVYSEWAQQVMEYFAKLDTPKNKE